MSENNKLILADLYSEESALSLASADQLNGLLNTPPRSEWVKKHPYIKDHYYLPIDKVEFLLKKIFKLYKIEVLAEGQILNSLYCKVRVHYWHPTKEEWLFHDGVGACELQTKKDTGSLKLDMTNINTGAIPMALPIAKTLALKDACDHLGTIFGSDLNRKDTVNLVPDEKLTNKAQEISKQLTEKIPA
jgi:hypothetical protein